MTSYQLLHGLVVLPIKAFFMQLRACKISPQIAAHTKAYILVQTQNLSADVTTYIREECPYKLQLGS